MSQSIIEAAIDADAAARGRLGLFVGRGERSVYTLHDAGALVDDIATNDPWRQLVLKQYIVATVFLKPRTGRDRVSEVEGVAARKGYGPLIYDIAMALAGGLMPDRGVVSSAAAAVWARYHDARPDVTAKPLSRAKMTHPGGKQNPLNYAYFIEHSPNVAALFHNHTAVTNASRAADHVIRDSDWEEASEEYFRERWMVG